MPAALPAPVLPPLVPRAAGGDAGPGPVLPWPAGGGRLSAMVPCGALLWRRLLRKRWVLGVVFGLSLVYFLSSTFKQVSASLPGRVLLEGVWDRAPPGAIGEPLQRCPKSLGALLRGEL